MSVRDAFSAAAAGFAATPGAAGEVTDLAFHHRPIRSVIGLPVRVTLTGFGVLQGGFVGMDGDNPAALGFGAFRPQWTCLAECPEAGYALTPSGADSHGVLGRAGHSAGGQVDAEPVFGIAVGVAHRGILARMSWPRPVFIQGSTIGISRIAIHLKDVGLRLVVHMLTVIGDRFIGIGGGGGVAQQLVDSLTVGGVG
jgi:hypothetical protein